MRPNRCRGSPSRIFRAPKSFCDRARCDCQVARHSRTSGSNLTPLRLQTQRSDCSCFDDQPSSVPSPLPKPRSARRFSTSWRTSFSFSRSNSPRSLSSIPSRTTSYASFTGVPSGKMKPTSTGFGFGAISIHSGTGNARYRSCCVADAPQICGHQAGSRGAQWHHEQAFRCGCGDPLARAQFLAYGARGPFPLVYADTQPAGSRHRVRRYGSRCDRRVHGNVHPVRTAVSQLGTIGGG